jgi:hypothetical protein
MFLKFMPAPSASVVSSAQMLSRALQAPRRVRISHVLAHPASARCRGRPYRNVRSYAHLVVESVCISTAHSRILGGLGLHFFRFANPQHVVAPYQDLAECA